VCLGTERCAASNVGSLVHSFAPGRTPTLLTAAFRPDRGRSARIWVFVYAPGMSGGHMSSRLVWSLTTRGVLGTLVSGRRYASSRLRRAKRYAEEWFFDRRFGVDTRGIVHHPHSDERAYREAVHYQGTSHSDFREMMRALPLAPATHLFLDLGCGKGKALVMAAQTGYRRLVGVELSPALAAVARQNLERSPVSPEYAVDFSVICGDASRYRLPPEPTVIFLANPFHAQLIWQVSAEIARSMAAAPRSLFVVYYNPVHAEAFRGPEYRLVVQHSDYVIVAAAGSST
jgi:SAM-dependent methyltransferase